MKALLFACLLIAGGWSLPAYAACGGGTNGTATLPSTLLTGEFQDGQAAGSIVPGCVRDIIATLTVLRVVTASGAITATSADHIIEVNKTVGAATTVNMPSCASNAGLQLIIIDGKGDAATNNIALTPSAGNINGFATFVMNVNRQGESVFYDGTQCVVYP
jgi:hypothetical protein